MNAQRCGSIELLRFLATLCIAVFHFEWIYVGHPVYFKHFYLFVEFFFVLSGFFMPRNVKKYAVENKYAGVQYVWKQLKKLWPPYIIAFFFSWYVYCKVNDVVGLKSAMIVLWRAKWELIFFHLTGFDLTAPVMNGVTAYIPALIIASLIIFCKSIMT